MPQNNDVESRLKEMKKQVDDAQRTHDQLQGRLDAALEELQVRFDCQDLPEAKKKLAVMEADLAQKEEDLEKRVQKLEADYEWEG